MHWSSYQTQLSTLTCQALQHGGGLFTHKVAGFLAVKVRIWRRRQLHLVHLTAEGEHHLRGVAWQVGV